MEGWDLRNIPFLYNYGLVDLTDLDIEDISPQAVASALCRIRRFSGNFNSISVAQHCILVSQVAELMGATLLEQFAALHHDDSEVFMGDVPEPVKKLCPEYIRLENEILDVIDEKYGCKTRCDVVKRADKLVEAREIHHHMDTMPLMSRITVRLPSDYAKYDIGQTALTPWPEEQVLARYMERNDELCEAIVYADEHAPPKQLETKKGLN